MPSSRPLPTVIGPTENALRALLTKLLSTTPIKTYSAWVVLNAASIAQAPASSGRWQEAVADALKVELGQVGEVLGTLCVAGLVSNDGSLTARGVAELAIARSTVSATTSRLIDGLSEEAQATARLVLDHIRGKADELLGL
jgi:hypothetical protein